jgi:subtilase family protein
MTREIQAPSRKSLWLLLGLATMVAATLAPLMLRSSAGAATTPNDPQFPSQWALTKVRAPQAWDITQGNASIKVAVVGTGVVSTLTDLQGQLGAGYNAISPGGSTQDDFGTYGDGTATAGIIGAATNNGTDIAGVSWHVTMLPVKVCDLTGNCPNAAIAAGINWAVSNGAQIINVGPALNPTSATTDINSAVANAVSRGVLVVASAGNYAGYVGYPANLPGVIAVGATDSTDTVASFSGRGAQLALVAPGVMVLSLARQGCCISFTGSEFAAAHVSGALGLLLAAGVPASTAKTAVLQGALDLGTVGWDSTYGYGRLDICNALVKAGKVCPATPATATATAVPATATATRTPTPAMATATPTPVPATATPTRVPSTATSTSVPPTATWTPTPQPTSQLGASTPTATPTTCPRGRARRGLC